MGTKHTIEQRAKVDSGFSERRSFAFRIGRPHAWMVAFAGVALSGLVDFATGDQLWVGPAYLTFIGFAAWALGWRHGMLALMVTVAVTFAANANGLYPYGSAASLWDFALRIPPVLGVIALLAHARHICDREWRLGRTDPLTGALNRKAFFELAGTITESKSWHVLAYADLDGLKRLNDAHGHQHGDESMTAFASHVRKAIRKDDIFARIGGDEFLVYLAVRDAQAGLTVANRLHRAMNSATSRGEHPLHCSVGALILAPGLRSIDRELRVADELMYEAKQTGSALAVATAREHVGGLTMAGRYMQTGTMIEDEAVGREFREARRAEGNVAPIPETAAPKKPRKKAA
ncbi:MAG: diguanylate cyclase [Proteobacteria bacterium]|nr:diguanylate cyclase [Pseudomonadota bacterium]